MMGRFIGSRRALSGKQSDRPSGASITDIVKNLPEILRIEPRGESGRVHQIADQDGQMPPVRSDLFRCFIMARKRLLLPGGGRNRLRDGLQQLLPVAERNAELLEVLLLKTE